MSDKLARTREGARLLGIDAEFDLASDILRLCRDKNTVEMATALTSVVAAFCDHNDIPREKFWDVLQRTSKDMSHLYALIGAEETQ